MRKAWIFAACICFLTWMSSSAGTLKETMIVMSYAGDVKVIPAGATEAVDCRPEMLLKAGDRIQTGAESYLELAFERGKNNIVRIEENSDVVLKLDSDEKVELINGEMFAVFRDLKKGEKFRVRTPCAVIGARGTGWNTKTDNEVTSVAVFEDKVFARGIDKDGSAMEEEFTVDEGFGRTVRKFEHPGEMFKIPEEEIAQMKDKFSYLGGAKTKESRESVFLRKDDIGLDLIDERREKEREKEDRGEKRESSGEKRSFTTGP